MNFRVLLLLLSSALMYGCVTTTTGDMASGASSEDAARLNLDLGISYFRQGDYEQAMIKLEKSLQEESNNSVAHRVLGMTYERLGDDVGAEKEYRTAVRQGSDDPDAINQLAVFLCRNGDREEAMRLFNSALEIPRYQERFMIYTNAGSCAKDDNLIVAEDYLRRALVAKPDYSEALYQMADVAFLSENYLQARAFMERYFSSSRLTPNSLWLSYRVEVALRDSSSARDFAEQLLREFPESVEARMLLDERRNAG
jgi:type IV pilus assembly protein PilF